MSRRLLLFLASLLPTTAPAQDTYLRVHTGYGRTAFFPDDVEEYTGNTAFNLGIFRERVSTRKNWLFGGVLISQRFGLEFRHLEATSAVPTERGIERYTYNNLEVPYVFGADVGFGGQQVVLLGFEAGLMVGVPVGMSGEHRSPAGVLPPVRPFNSTYERPVVYFGGQGDLHLTLHLGKILLRAGYGGQLPFSLITRPVPEDQAGGTEYKAIGLRSSGFSAAVSVQL